MMRFAALLLVLGVCACSRPAEPPSAASGTTAPVAITKTPTFDSARMLGDIKVLSSDEFEGRAPGSKGEELTVKFLQDAFTKIGLKPGNTDGTFVQPLPLVGITATNTRPLTVTGPGKKTTFRWSDDVVAWTKRVADTASIENSEIVFAGYGVTAPEFKWDDFKDVDVKGKTILVLVNDPQIPSASDPSQLDPALFNGKAMTYYGRWTYKFEEGARRGAAGILIVHETGPAGYPFTVVQGNLRERFDLITPDKNMGRASIEGWVTLDAAKKLLAQAGQDFDALKKQALTRDFRPVPLGLQASLAIRNSLRTIQSKNVLARLEGSDPQLRDEYVVYTAHWDHLGKGAAVDGDDIYNGALDNASGVAAVLEIARAFTAVEPRPKRSVLFLMVGAEEQGLLGAQHYAENPGLPAREDAGQHQHRRRQPVGTDERHHRRRHGRLRPRRLPARRGLRTGTRAAAGPGVGERLLLPIGSLQLRQAGCAGAVHRHRHRVRRQARGVQSAEARRVHEQGLPRAVRRDKA